MIPVWHRLSQEAKDQIIEKLARLLAQREELQFACIHGSFLEQAVGFRDIDIAVWVDSSIAARKDALSYEWDLSSWLEHGMSQPSYPIDAKVLNHAPLSFRYAACGGRLLLARDESAWYDFRERTWIEYLDFAPLARQILRDLLDSPRS